MTQNPNSNPNSYPTRDAIEQRAQEIWEQRGRPDGQELDHWYQAEKELLEMRTKAEKTASSSPAAKPSTAPAAPAKAPMPPTPAPPAPKVDPKKPAAPTPPKKK